MLQRRLVAQRRGCALCVRCGDEDCDEVDRGLAKLLVADGATVLVGDLHAERPESLPDGVEYLQLDVSDDAAWVAVLTWVEQHWGRLDLLVNNAGIAVGGRIDTTAMPDWERALSINLMGAVRGSRTFVSLMKRRGSGQIVNTASLAGLVHAPAMAAYNATKAAVVALSETMQNELSPFGITVSVICPSFFRTNLAQSLTGSDTEMEAAAVDLITQTPRSAPQVSAAAFAGKHIVLTDTDGQVAYRVKRFARPVYDASMAAAGRQVRDGKDLHPSGLRRLNARLTRHAQ